MEENKTNKEYIDLREVAGKLWSKKLLFLKVWAVTIILASLYIFPVPRTYTSSVSMAPENSAVPGGSLSSLASSFGFNIGDMNTEDAFYPELYPEVVQSNEFIVGLFDVNVCNEDGDVKTNYYTYLKDHQKKAFYKIPISWVTGFISSIFTTENESKQGIEKINPLHLSRNDDALVEKVRNNVSCAIDKKTNVITITVIDQDKYICAAIADSVRVRLQDFITHYRTNKARKDVLYYTKLTTEAKKEYDYAVARYSAYCDANQGTILQAFISERDKMENEMSLKLNAYNAMNAQLQASKAKVQENTPAFTTLHGAAIPVKAAGPKRVLFILAMLILASFITAANIFRKEIGKQLIHIK